MLAPQQLDQLVTGIALYPDPLIAQVLAAATYYDQIPEAAQWADQHHYLTGDQLAAAIKADNVPWDPSVQALLPFPAVLDKMATDMAWTTQLGNAFLAQPNDVMDAVQRMRHSAYQYGYLRTTPQVAVTPGPYITIVPINPLFIPVPYWDPAVVFFAPRPGFFIGAGIGWGYGINLGLAFAPWGWSGGIRIGWGAHALFFGGAPWGRRWDNRFAYVHPGYRGFVARPAGGYRAGAHINEGHALQGRSEREKSAARFGHARVEEHSGGHGRGH
jgi:hypothetical protein